MRKGDVLCFVSKGLAGKAIEFFQSFEDVYNKDKINLPIDPDRITHVGFAINDKEFVEAGIKVRKRKLSDIKDRVVYHCILKDELRRRIYRNNNHFMFYINKTLGKIYDILQIPKIAFSILSFGLWKPKESVDRVVCSEFLYAAFKRANIIGKIKNPSIGKPSDVFQEDWFKARVLWR